MVLAQVFGGGADDLVGPLVAAGEIERPHLDAGASEPVKILREDLGGVPLVAGSVAHERAAHPRERRGFELGRHVATDGDHPGHRPRRRGGRAKHHRDALRESSVAERVTRRPLTARGGDDRCHIGEVVGNRQLAILTRHPPSDNVVGPPLVKPIQPLDGHDQPSIGAGNRAQAVGVLFRRFRVTVKPDQHRRGTRIGRRHDDVPSMRGRAYRPLFHQFHQITVTVPEPRMSASRVMSGSPAVRADAQISASNGSRVNRSSSATKTSSGVMSIGWYAGLLNKSLKNSRTVRRKFTRATRASMLHSHMTTVGTYRIASRRSHRSKNAVARGPSLPPPAAWNPSACGSVTAAPGYATSLFWARARHSGLRRGLADD